MVRAVAMTRSHHCTDSSAFSTACKSQTLRSVMSCKPCTVRSFSCSKCRSAACFARSASESALSRFAEGAHGYRLWHSSAVPCNLSLYKHCVPARKTQGCSTDMRARVDVGTGVAPRSEVCSCPKLRQCHYQRGAKENSWHDGKSTLVLSQIVGLS